LPRCGGARGGGGGLPEGFGLVGPLPGKLRLCAPEVAVGSGLLEYGPAQVQAFNYSIGGEVEMRAHKV
jgi:hypothetical protein